MELTNEEIKQKFSEITYETIFKNAEIETPTLKHFFKKTTVRWDIFLYMRESNFKINQYKK